MKKLKEYFIKNNKKLIIAASVIIITFALINIYFVVEVQNVSNDECLWVEKNVAPDSTVIFFQSVKVEGVTWNAGIRDGDQLIAINDTLLDNAQTATRVLNRVEEGEYANYLVKSNGDIFSTKVYIKKLFNFPAFAQSLLGFFWFLIAFVVLMAKPAGMIQKLFYGIGAALVFTSGLIIIQSQNIIQATGFSNILNLIIAYLLSLSLCYLPFLVLYFFWIFPRKFKFVEKSWIKILVFVIPGILSIVLFTIVLLVFFFNEIPNKYLNDFANVIFPLTSFANIVAYISLIINYKRLESKDEKKPILIILSAFTLAIAANIYTAFIAPAITDTIFNSPEFYAPIVLVIIFPIAFAYAIFKYQLMDVSIVVKNTIMYGAATVAVAATYFLVIYVIGQRVSEAIGTEYQGVIAGAVFIVFAMIFQSSKNKFQDFLTARFYPEQFAYQKVLIGFSNEVSSMVGLEKILDSMQTTLVPSLMIKNFGIMLRDTKENNFILVRNTGFKYKDLVLEDFNLKEFIDGKLEITKHPIIEIEDFEKVFPKQAKILVEDQIFTIIPMIIKNKVIGLLLFGLKHSGAQFAGKDLELLYAVASQAGIAIENARLYESEAEKIKIERDLNLARKIQQGLLPKCIPNINGLDICGEMIPAMQVGGDYFDLIPVSDTQLFVVVGDVSGKGLSASLYMTKLQTMIQLSCSFGKTPKEILVDINKRIYTSIERNWFITMTLALFDTEKRTLKFCRAGHMPILAARNGSIKEYRTQGIGVGLEKGIIFEKTLVEEELTLEPGQTFAFYSDGITEAMNEKLELFGEENLAKIMNKKSGNYSTEIMDEIWNSLTAFRGKAEQSDDMTIVLVKVKG